MASNIVDSLKVYQKKLQAATRYDQVLEISRSLSFLNISKSDINNELRIVAENITRQLCKHFAGTKVIAHHKVIFRAIFKFAIYGNISELLDELILNKYEEEYGLIGYNCMKIYGRLQNFNICQNHRDLVDTAQYCFVHGSLKYSKETRFFPIAIENQILMYEKNLIEKNNSFTFTVICTNLENSHKTVHKLLLELFQHILIKADENDEREVLELVMGEMSWYNRNKHYLLISIIKTRPEMLLNYKSFNISIFLKGLRCGLSQYHLYSSALSLVKVIYDKVPYRDGLIEISTDIIINGSNYELKNFLKLWFTCFDDKLKDELFRAVTNGYDFTKISSTSKLFYRALLIRNAFNRPLSSQIENSAKMLCYSIDDVAIKLEMFNILLSDIYSSKTLQTALENILRFLKFLHFNMCVEDSQYLDDIMRKLPNFFNHLATSRFRNVQICKEIFTIIRDDLFFHGMCYGSYESRVFSVKLLQIMFKQYCGTSKSKKLTKKTNSGQSIIKYLSDHKIWDMTSVEIFNHLVRMSRDTENSDICAIANEIILEYFIKNQIIDEKVLDNGSNFIEWINVRVNENLNIADVESYHENISYCKMKIEHLIAKSTTDCVDELELLISYLEVRHRELKILKDPVTAMEQGKNLFVLIDTINYALSRIDKKDLQQRTVLRVADLATEIALQFLHFVNDGEASPSFDLLDKNLTQLVNTSKLQTNDSAEMKHKLLLSFFFTTRALSELSVTLANIVNDTLEPHQTEYFMGMSMCIKINVQILTRFCHKGVIEAASQCLGSITKIISTEFLQQCDRTSAGARHLQKLLIILKLEIDCGRRHSSKTGEIRGSRGLILMAHLIIRNHPAFLKFIMDQYLVLKDLQNFYDTLEIKFSEIVQPIHLHLLAVIVKDSELVEEMLPYYDYILMATFRAYKESKDFIMQNALLQIIGNITTKISNHKRHSIVEESEKPQYESKSISVYEHYVKFTYSYRIALFDLENNFKDLSQTYIIILLEILSNFEFRSPFDYSSELDRPIDAYKQLIDHPCEKIRVLAAKCFAQWHRINEIQKGIRKSIWCIFGKNPNLAHGNIMAARFMIQRYEASVKFVQDFDIKEFLKELRLKVLKKYEDGQKALPNNFYLRYHLFELLVFLGFTVDDEIIQNLMNEETVTSKVGYQLWRQKMLEYSC